MYKNIIIATSLAALMSTSAFATDCEYKKDVKLSSDGSILSADTKYVCKESKPIIVLPPNVANVIIENKPIKTSWKRVIKSEPITETRTVYVSEPRTVYVSEPRLIRTNHNRYNTKKVCYADWHNGGSNCVYEKVRKPYRSKRNNNKNYRKNYNNNYNNNNVYRNDLKINNSLRALDLILNLYYNN